MFKVKSIYEYTSGHEDDLAFPIGQIITVTAEEDADWYAGEYVDGDGVNQEGIFPRNFVEKFEPTAPPRPTRTRTKKEPEPAAAAADPAAAPSPLSPKLPDPEPEEEVEDAKAAAPTQTSAAPPPVPAPGPEAPVPKPQERAAAPPPAPKPAEAPATSSAPAPAPKPLPTQSKPKGPPPVSEKPTTSSFRDRIAAFNKPAAAPVTPFQPGNSGFIKKPFVAPPPSRNAYIPPTRDVPVANVYRRDEDPEVKEREAENMETAEKAGLIPRTSIEGEDEDEPKPMSLKERLALLQKQQLEAAQRHTDSMAKKEKPKRPPKKRMEAQEGREDAENAAPSPLERRDTEDGGRKQSVEEQHPPRPTHAHRRKSSKGPEPRDGNEADMSGAGDTTEDPGDLTEREDSDERPRHLDTTAKRDDEELGDEEEEDEEEDDEVDSELRRKEELRARMARIAGGMTGMAGIFGGPMPGAAPSAPPRKKKSVAERQTNETSEENISPGGHAPPVPMAMALPGMSRTKSPEPAPQEEPSQEHELEEESETETPYQENIPPSLPSREPTGAPPIPAGRPAPPPIPVDSRPPPPPPTATKSPTEGSESDDELSEAKNGVAQATRAPPPPPVAVPPPALPTSPRSTQQNRLSYIGDDVSLASPTGAAPAPPGRRNSRPPPPVPGSAPVAPPAQTRPPPPPPPGAGISRASTADTQPLSPTRSTVYEDDDGEEEITEYEGDYDTDIASSAPHKDALKAHQRESSFEETTPVVSPVPETRASFPPPMPSTTAPRTGPPPVPSQPPPDKRKSTDMPRAMPPPPPPPKEAPSYDDDYDPYNYTASSGTMPAMPIVSQPPLPPRASEEAYSPRRTSFQAPQQERRAPPSAPVTSRSHRASLDVQRAGATGRRSVDVARPSMESGFVANEIDLAHQSGWWLQPKSLPPQLQGRKDIFYESEESTSNSPHRGGKTTVTRDIYVLYQDYSQTVITVQFDPQDASDVRLEQRHEPPPRTLRQDQLEQNYERFGRAIGEAVLGKKDTVVGDGTPQALVYELLRPHKEALLPVGTRAYGALVYSNLANASTSQNDEIRPGDIISVRNAKFQGKHGAMHAKYSMEVGKPDHVAVVAEWDGTKKKVRAWEQGRESKKVKLESFRLDDLRSGEVKIWRVMPRSWVGWEGDN